LLYDVILSDDAKKKLATTKASDLILRLDDNLVHIPWELLYDGEQFLCRRFSMGRIVSTRQQVTEGVARSIGKPLKMLVVADPRGDLPHSANEGGLIRDVLDAESDYINANLKINEVTVEYVKSKLRDFDIVHYAGHADYDSKDPSLSGWLLDDGKFSSADVKSMTGARPLPALVFANGCQSGATEQWQVTEDYEEQIFGLANAFLLAGVQHYIGTFWDILDSPGADFAIAFYRETLDGHSVGEAVRRARMELIDKYGEDTIVWASYMLYGDPTRIYIDLAEEEEDEVAEAASAHGEPVTAVAGGPRGVAPSAVGEAVRTGGPSFTSISIGILAVLLVILVGVGIWKFTRTEAPIVPPVQVSSEAGAYEKAFALLRNGKAAEAEQAFLAMAQGDNATEGLDGLAAVFYETGRTEEARRKAAQTLREDPDRLYAHVVLGKIALDEQDNETARNEFMAATKIEGGLEWQRAVAYNQLGRIYAADGDNTQAAQNYARAVGTDPKNTEARANHGVTLARMGKTDEAIEVFEEAKKADPNDVVIASLLRDTVMRQQLANNSEKQRRIRESVNDLIARRDTGTTAPAAAAKGDEWTSRPQTITFLDLRSMGLIPGREGENDYILLMLTQAFQQDGRIKVVDRAMLDVLLNELKISSSDLADPRTALKLGRLLSARLIATGSIIRDVESVQVSMRVIETETSNVAVALAEPMDRKLGINKVADRISGMLLQKIKSAFPIRGIIEQVHGNTVDLNIGSDVGIMVGTKLDIVQPEIEGKGRVIGTVEVTEVKKTQSKAKIIEKKVRVYRDMKVEEQVP